MGKLFWVLLVLIILIGICVGVYFCFFWNYDKFPQKIGAYSLKQVTPDTSDCGLINGQNVCIDSYRLEYISGDSAIHILPIKVVSGKEAYINYLKSNIAEFNFEGKAGVMRGKERWELYWITDKGKFGSLGSQTYKLHYNSDGSINSEALNATTNNIIIQYFLEKYPPVTV